MNAPRLQFHLRAIFVLTAAVALFLGLNSAVLRAGGLEALLLIYGSIVALLLFHFIGRAMGLFVATIIWGGWRGVAWCGRLCIALKPRNLAPVSAASQLHSQQRRSSAHGSAFSRRE
jgi:hypothetical protein